MGCTHRKIYNIEDSSISDSINNYTVDRICRKQKENQKIYYDNYDEQKLSYTDRTMSLDRLSEYSINNKLYLSDSFNTNSNRSIFLPTCDKNNPNDENNISSSHKSVQLNNGSSQRKIFPPIVENSMSEQSSYSDSNYNGESEIKN